MVGLRLGSLLSGSLTGLALSCAACSAEQPLPASSAGAAAGGLGTAGASLAGGGAGLGGSTSAGTSGAAGGGQAGEATAGAGGATTMAGAAGQGGMEPMGPPALKWLGRVEKTATGARFSWPGTGVTARFDGTGMKLSLKLSQTDYFQLVVDDQVSLLAAQAGQHDYDVAKDLPPGVHTVTLWRRTETNNGAVELGNVGFTGDLL